METSKDMYNELCLKAKEKGIEFVTEDRHDFIRSFLFACDARTEYTEKIFDDILNILEDILTNKNHVAPECIDKDIPYPHIRVRLFIMVQSSEILSMAFSIDIEQEVERTALGEYLYSRLNPGPVKFDNFTQNQKIVDSFTITDIIVRKNDQTAFNRFQSIIDFQTKRIGITVRSIESGEEKPLPEIFIDMSRWMFERGDADMEGVLCLIFDNIAGQFMTPKKGYTKHTIDIAFKGDDDKSPASGVDLAKIKRVKMTMEMYMPKMTQGLLFADFKINKLNSDEYVDDQDFKFSMEVYRNETN